MKFFIIKNMDAKKLFDLILKDVLPFAAERVSKLANMKYDPEKLIIDNLTILSIKKLYKNYIKILLNCDYLDEIINLMTIERVSDFDLIDSYSNLSDFLRMINKLRNTNLDSNSVGIKFIVIKWGFLPIFEDILYTKNLECPITMPTYFSAFYMVYNDTKVWEKMADQEIENDTLRISIVKKHLDNKSILLENDFLIEGSTLEGMYVYAYFNNLNYKYLHGTIQFYVGDEKIKFKDYVENKKSLLAEDYDGLLPSYTSMLEPGGEIINYQQLTFVEGFNILNEILEGIMYINFENTIHNIQNSSYVKT